MFSKSHSRHNKLTERFGLAMQVIAKPFDGVAEHYLQADSYPRQAALLRGLGVQQHFVEPELARKLRRTGRLGLWCGAVVLSSGYMAFASPAAVSYPSIALAGIMALLA